MDYITYISMAIAFGTLIFFSKKSFDKQKEIFEKAQAFEPEVNELLSQLEKRNQQS